MKFIIDHDYHIHSELSECSSDPLQTPLRMLEYAKRAGLTDICITDHFWDECIPGATDWYKAQNLTHVKQSLPLPTAEGINFRFGAETEMDKFFKVGMSLPCFDNFEFVIIPTTHMHMRGFVISDKDAESNLRRAELWVERLDKLLDMPLPFHKIGIAHLACSLMNNKSHADYLETLSLISDSDMRRVFTKAASVGCGIELNRFDLDVPDSETDTVYRMFLIAKECGCRFYLGSDAHHPNDLESSIAVFKRAVDILGLTEDDKFRIGE
ncbi:MAG: hypothetical protein IJW03_02790 [Clostridia bacterium]|nr:hypothetical protein [Clostridia bacterium]